MVSRGAVARGLGGLVMVAFAADAQAHKPTFLKDGHGSPAMAYRVDDVETSTVTYWETTCESPELWLSFQATADTRLEFTLGLPRLGWLEHFRPTIAIVAHGLPVPAPGDVPFKVPEGMGVLLFPSNQVQQPRQFHEPFSQTSSWVLVKESVELPVDGPAYMVAWDPLLHTGKLWIALGSKEDFSPEDWIALPRWVDQVRQFHEAWPYNAHHGEQRVCSPGHPE